MGGSWGAGRCKAGLRCNEQRIVTDTAVIAGNAAASMGICERPTGLGNLTTTNIYLGVNGQVDRSSDLLYLRCYKLFCNLGGKSLKNI